MPGDGKHPPRRGGGGEERGTRGPPRHTHRGRGREGGERVAEGRDGTGRPLGAGTERGFSAARLDRVRPLVFIRPREREERIGAGIEAAL